MLPSQGWWGFGHGLCEGFALTAVVIIRRMTSVGDVFITPSRFGRRAGIFTPVPGRRKPGKKPSSFSLSLHSLPPRQGAWCPDCAWGEGRGTLLSLLSASLQREDLFISSS